MKNGHSVSGSWEDQDDVEKSQRQLSLLPRCRGLPLAEHRASWRAGSTLPALCYLHLTSTLAPCCSVWRPSAKQNRMKPLAKVGQTVLKRHCAYPAVDLADKAKKKWWWGQLHLLLSRHQCAWGDPPGLARRVSPLLSSRVPRAYPKQGLPPWLRWVKGWR